MKERKLRKIIRKYIKEGVIIAFSGGVDSALVLKVASEEANRTQNKIKAVSFRTFLMGADDVEKSKEIAEYLNVELIEKYIDETKNINIINNKKDRCFHCKKTLFEEAIKIAKSENCKYVLDGTNIDDLKVYRPGLKALAELGIKSPLQEAGLTKEEVRKLARKLNIPVYDRPSKPCLATRFPYNQKIDISKFKMIETGEEILSNMGFKNNRIRVYDDNTRIEIPISDFEKFMENREIIVEELKKLGFKYINLDMEGFRSGSMDE